MEPHGRDENEENILDDMIRGEDDASHFLNDSSEGMSLSTEETASPTPGKRLNSASPMREKPKRQKPAAPV